MKNLTFLILLKKCLEMGIFIPLINKPTRISLNSASLLDHICINSKTTLNLNCVILTYCVSDHLPVFLSTSIEKLKVTTTNTNVFTLKIALHVF